MYGDAEQNSKLKDEAIGGPWYVRKTNLFMIKKAVIYINDRIPGSSAIFIIVHEKPYKL